MPRLRPAILALLLVTPAALEGCLGLFSCDGSGPAIAEASGTLTEEDEVLEMNVTLENETGLAADVEWSPEVGHGAKSGTGIGLRMEGHDDPDGNARFEVEESACQEWEAVAPGTHSVEAFFFEIEAEDSQTGPQATPPEPIDVNVAFQTIS